MRIQQLEMLVKLPEIKYLSLKGYGFKFKSLSSPKTYVLLTIKPSHLLAIFH